MCKAHRNHKIFTCVSKAGRQLLLLHLKEKVCHPDDIASQQCLAALVTSCCGLVQLPVDLQLHRSICFIALSSPSKQHFLYQFCLRYLPSYTGTANISEIFNVSFALLLLERKTSWEIWLLLTSPEQLIPISNNIIDVHYLLLHTCEYSQLFCFMNNITYGFKKINTTE
jgi:hypothetical protein